MISQILLILSISFFFHSLQSWCYSDVTPAEIHTRLASGDTLILLDVREYSEYQLGHIAEPDGYLPLTPVNMPWYSNVLQTEYYRLPMNQDIVVYCQSGGRSAAASAFLESKGFTQIYNLLGGFGSWTFETRDGGYGDHSGSWVDSNDSLPSKIICIGSGDTSNIIIPPTAFPGQDSVYVELHFASNKPFLPPDLPESDMDGLFRITTLDKFGLCLFDCDSLALNDSVNIKLTPYFHSNIIFYPALKVFVPGNSWKFVESNFSMPSFYRNETRLRRWYNCEGWFTTDVLVESNPPENFMIAAYPNPFNSSVNIVAPAEASISIYDTNGRLIEELESPVWSPAVSIGSGVYIISVHFKDRIVNTGIVYLK